MVTPRRLRGLLIHDQVEPVAELHGQVGRLRAFQDLVHEAGGALTQLSREGPVGAYETLGHKRLDTRMEPFLVTYPAGAAVPPRYSHRGEAFMFVLKGRIEFHYDGQAMVLRAGDSVYFDNELPHGGRAAGTSAALVVTLEP